MSQAARALHPEPLELSELQLDALGETFNLALGEAASAFSTMLSQEVALTVPTVELLSREQLIARFESEHSDRLCGINQHFSASADFRTETMLVFPEKSSLDLVRQLLGQSDIVQITELEQDALAEIGNVIINACMSSLADRLNTEIEGSLPVVRSTDPRSLFDAPTQDTLILVARIDMRLEQADVSGFVLFIMDVASIRNFVAKVSLLFGL